MEERDGEVETLLGALRQHGLRITNARRAIVSALVDGPDHLTAEGLTARVVGRGRPGPALSTVYRTLAVLSEHGLVERHDLSAGPATYHRSGLAHHHLVCRSCGAVVLVPTSAFDRLAEDLRAYGFEVDGHRASVTGQCAACAAHRTPETGGRQRGVKAEPAGAHRGRG